MKLSKFKAAAKTFLLLLIALVAIEAALRLIGRIYLNDVYKDLSEPAQKFTIVCLGESTTTGLWLPFSDSYPKQLEKFLREHYSRTDITVLVPPHVGQNTSQVLNRIDDYADRYHPRLFILMVGANNEWSFGESNIVRFLPANDFNVWRARLAIALDNIRLYKIIRYASLRLILRDKENPDFNNTNLIWGHPEYSNYPPPEWKASFASKNRDAFVQLWRSDVSEMIDSIQRRRMNVMLMTYPMGLNYLPADTMAELARDKGIALIRNDLSFRELAKKEPANNYLMPDHWHPNAKGYGVVAANAFRKIVRMDLLGIDDHQETQ